MAGEKAKDVAGQAADILLDILKQMGITSTDIARNIIHAIIDKPYISGLIAKLGSTGVSFIKTGGLTKFVADFAAAKQAGASLKAAFKTAFYKTNAGVSTHGFVQAGKAGKAGTVVRGVGKALAILAAIQIAKKTVDAASAAAGNKWDKFRNKPNFKTGWELFWETSIPVATYRWIESAVKQKDIHATPWSDGKTDNAGKQQEPLKSTEAKQEEYKIPQATTIDYDSEAKSLGLGTRPKGDSAHPYAQEQWRKEVEKQMKRKNSNHPEWYTKFPEFITTNLNFGVRKEAQYFDIAIGSRIMYVPTIPHKGKVVSQAYKDQMNVLFAKLRGSNSGAFNYTVSDVMAYVECTRSIRIVMYQIAKLIKSINNVDLYLAKTPEAFMGVMGLNAAGILDLKQNRALYVARYNQMAELIKANFPLAPDMTVYDRDKYIASIILEDGKGPKSSIYTYITEQVFCASSTAGKIEPKIIDPTSVSEMFRNLETLINQAHAYVSATYSNYDTFAKIAGDMFKAYGNSCLYGFDLINLNDKNQVVYDEYLLHQLQNAQIITYGSGSDLTWTTDAPENITYSTKIYIPGDSSHNIPAAKIPCNVVAGADPVVINTNKSGITGAEALSLTRGIWYFELSSALTYNTNTTVELDTCDTVVFKTMYIDYFDANNAIQTIKIASTGYSVGPTSALYQSLWSQMDYAPALWRFKDSDNLGSHHLVEDIDTYAYMTVDQFRAFTDTAVLSMYKTVDISDQVNFRSVKR